VLEPPLPFGGALQVWNFEAVEPLFGARLYFWLRPRPPGGCVVGAPPPFGGPEQVGSCSPARLPYSQRWTMSSQSGRGLMRNVHADERHLLDLTGILPRAVLRRRCIDQKVFGVVAAALIPWRPSRRSLIVNGPMPVVAGEAVGPPALWMPHGNSGGRFRLLRTDCRYHLFDTTVLR